MKAMVLYYFFWWMTLLLTILFTQLPMDMSMLWHFHRINKVWFKVVGKTSTWKTLEIVKFNNVSYCHTIVKQGLPRLSLKSWLKFELECLQYCIMRWWFTKFIWWYYNLTFVYDLSLCTFSKFWTTWLPLTHPQAPWRTQLRIEKCRQRKEKELGHAF